jgi:ADP-dependent NAD(P)H-hydrate dehydratase / NAD(P)H-hydrate epimerase
MYLRPRHKNSNKSDFPKVGVYAGSPGMWGAAVMALRSCYRMGAGYVYFFTPTESSEVLAAVPEALSWDFNKPVDSLVVGPGSAELRFDLLKKAVAFHLPCVLDAGAFDCMIQNRFFHLHNKVLLTPHEGEMSRLLNQTTDWVKHNRKVSVEELQKKTGACILLKGNPSLLFDGVRYLEIEAGNASLAKAGAGDVLAGILGALLGHSSEHFFQQIADGVYFHGHLANIWTQKNSIHSLTASDLIDLIPENLPKTNGSDF